MSSNTPRRGARSTTVPEASPFSSVLARLPDLSPPRTKYTNSFGSLQANPMASPPATSFGFRPQSGQTPTGGSSQDKPIMPYDLLGTTPLKSLQHGDQQLSSPQYDLQPPKIPLFHPPSKMPLGTIPTPPSARLADSSGGGAAGARFSSPYGSLLDGNSRTGPSPGSTNNLAPARTGAAMQARFTSTLFTSDGNTLDEGAASLGKGDIPPPSARLHPCFLSPLRAPTDIALRRPSSIGAVVDAAPAAAHTAASSEDHQQQKSGAVVGATAGLDVIAAAAASAGEREDEVAAMLQYGKSDGGEAEVDGGEAEEDGGEAEADGGEEEEEQEYVLGSFQRQAPLRGAGASRAQQVFQARQRPMRRRQLCFGGSANGTQSMEEEQEQLVRCKLPQSPICQAVTLALDAINLPIPRLRETSSASEGGSGSPTHRQHPEAYSLDSPAVQAATHAAVAAALEASTGAGGPRRPARAAAAGAAAAAKAAAEEAATPMQRCNSSHMERSSSEGEGTPSGALPPFTPGDEGVTGTGGASEATFAGPKKCNCKKSKCLKLYCDCFANGGYCGPACSCASCANKVENRAMVSAQRESIKQRNPNAFIQKIEADSALGGQHRRGCNCKKSHCMKKYCECFQAGVPCGEHCKCESCHNTTARSGRRPTGGGASKRARVSVGGSQTVSTRQHATRMAVGSSALAHRLREAQSLHTAMAEASAYISAAAGSSKGSATVGGSHPSALFPLLQPSPGSDGMPVMLPLMLPSHGPAPPLPLPLPHGAAHNAPAAPALTVSQAIHAAGAGGGSHAAPKHETPVIALLAPPAATAAAVSGGTAPGGDTFSFHPRLSRLHPTSTITSGQSTPRATAAAAAADFAFSLDTPAATIPVSSSSALETGENCMVGRRTPTKRKPARTMTAALH